MTSEEQRIAIAKTCGWKKIHKRNRRLERSSCGTLLMGEHASIEGMPMPDGINWCKVGRIPDYLNDLNAMHDAEKKLSLEERNAYMSWLWTICNRAHRMASVSGWLVPTSTATQRAEAFLRVKGLWKD